MTLHRGRYGNFPCLFKIVLYTNIFAKKRWLFVYFLCILECSDLIFKVVIFCRTVQPQCFGGAQNCTTAYKGYCEGGNDLEVRFVSPGCSSFHRHTNFPPDTCLRNISFSILHYAHLSSICKSGFEFAAASMRRLLFEHDASSVRLLVSSLCCYT